MLEILPENLVSLIATDPSLFMQQASTVTWNLILKDNCMKQRH